MIPRLCTARVSGTPLCRRVRMLAGIVVTLGRAATLMYGQATNVFPSSGNVGIGTTSPWGKLEVVGWNGIRVGGGNSTMVQVQGDSNYDWGQNSIFSTQNGGMGIQSRWYPASTNLVLQRDNGNVGIGTTNPQYKLAVNGDIGAKDIIVTNIGWSDCVFRPGYRLRPLAEINAYIQEHRHLPEIPTEAEVKEKGVSLGEMQAKLLAKVEELTLHLIQEYERNNRLEQRNRELEERLARLEHRAMR